MIIFSENLRWLMKHHGPETTQKVLGAAIEVAQGTISTWLNGREPDRPNREKLAKFFGVAVGDLMAKDFIERAERGQMPRVSRSRPDESSKTTRTAMISLDENSGYQMNDLPADAREDAKRLAELRKLNPSAADGASYMIAASLEKATRALKKKPKPKLSS